MKKITLFLCFSIVGLIGFAQQSVSKSDINNISNQETSFVIKIDNMDFNDYEDQILLESNDFNMINLKNNTHELSHNSANTSSIERNYIEGAYSYNEYALNFDFEPIMQMKVKI
ncbi:MAG: hypothetical protein L3J34_05340 [Flavobacteriaceae bacterium]|nr:hypothetical protein [Flavobacteriaceae bacterium]